MQRLLSPFRPLTALLAFGLLLAPLAGLAQPAPAVAAPSAMPPRLQPGDLAPDFAVRTPDGQTLRLSDLRGKLVLLDIWATWCGPCVAAMPHHHELAKKFAANDFVLLAVCANDSPEAYDGWVKRNGAKYAFRTAFDPAGRDGWAKSVFNTQYHVSGFPSLFMIGKDGRIIGTTTGGGAGENPHVTRLLAKAGLPIDTSHLPPEVAADARPKVIPAMGKTMATRARTLPTARIGRLSSGDVVPDFAVQGRDGKEIRLSSFKDSPVFIAFWTGARSPVADVAAIQAAYADQGLKVWAINVATEKAEFDAWYDREKIANAGFTASWDPAGKAFLESAANTQFGIGLFPAYAVVRKDGSLVGGIVGAGPKVSGWLREPIARAGIRLTEADATLLRGVLDTFHAEQEKAAAGNATTRPAAAIMAPPAGAPSTAAATSPRPALLAPGAVAPDFVMQDVTGREVRLSDFKGKVVILDFWATWCGPCIASFPHAQEIAARYKDQDVVLLASGTSDTIEAFKQWIPKNQPKYPNLQFVFDPNARNTPNFEQRASASLYGVTGIPTQFVIGRDGKIAAALVGNNGKDDARAEAALASVGVKVDPAIVARGRQQLADAADAEKERAAAAIEAAKKPQFRESYLRTANGQTLPEVTVENADGKPVSLSSVTAGKVTVITVWGATQGPGEDAITFLNGYTKRYADQPFQVLGLAAYGNRDGYLAWRAASAASVAFPIVYDPAGSGPRPDKDFNAMTDEEKKAFSAVQRAHMDKVVPMKLAGGMMAPLPHTIVIDAQGRVVGFCVGTGPRIKESLGNLLLRAGITLAAEDQPTRVFTREESKDAPPPPRREMLKVGATAPDFTTQDLAGKDVRLSDFKGKVVILDFWATWCGPCMAAMPHTQKVAAQYKDQGVVVLGSCTSDTRGAFERWVRANQAKYPDILWSHDKAERGDKNISRTLYGVGGIPCQFVIDREGKIVEIVTGYMEGEVILDAALAKAGIKVAPEIVAKGAEDVKRRNAMRGN